MTIPRIRSTCTASSTPRSGQSWWGACRARILPRSTATPRRWATGTSRFPRGTHGNPTPSSCWTHCPPACATITSKNSERPSSSGTKRAAGWTKPSSVSWRPTATPSCGTASPIIPATKSPASFSQAPSPTIRTTSNRQRTFPAGSGCATAF